MHYFRWSVILTVAGVSGGLFLTLLSGLYTVKPFVMDAEIIYFGFPFAWFKAVRSTWGRPPLSWQYFFFWQDFFIDVMIYGLLTAVALYLYSITITAGRKQAKQLSSASSKLKYG